MNITDMKNQILVNRTILACLYEQKAAWKAEKRIYDEADMQEAEYDTHNYIKKISKTITRLVKLQQGLKEAVRNTTEFRRAMKAK